MTHCSGDTAQLEEAPRPSMPHHDLELTLDAGEFLWNSSESFLCSSAYLLPTSPFTGLRSSRKSILHLSYSCVDPPPLTTSPATSSAPSLLLLKQSFRL